MSLFRTRFDTSCTVEVEHSFDNLFAHVELDGDVPMYPGDRVLVHGASIQLPYGKRIVERRTATVTRANIFERAWVRLKSQFEITELYEVWFSNGKTL